MNRPLASLTKTSSVASPSTSSAASLLVGLFEHRLTAEASPMVSLALTLPAGSKFSVNEEDCGQVAAGYKHALLQVQKNAKPAPTITKYFYIEY
jgi:hypothetical protein